MTADETDIRALIAAYAAAIAAKDPDGAQAPFAPGAVIFGLAPPLVSLADDPEAGRAGFMVWFDTWRGPIDYDTRDLVVLKSGHLALARGLLHIHGTKSDGEQVSTWTRVTYGLRKLSGAWKIVHEHLSTPFYMDGSYRAAADLKP